MKYKNIDNKIPIDAVEIFNRLQKAEALRKLQAAGIRYELK